MENSVVRRFNFDPGYKIYNETWNEIKRKDGNANHHKHDKSH